MEKRYTLPSMEKKISIHSVGKESGLNWIGDFVYKRPTIAQRGLIEVLTARLNGDMTTISPNISYLNEAIAHLRFTLTTYPPWWKDCDFGGSLYDTNIISELYTKCIDFEKEWSEKMMSGDPEKVEEAEDGKIPSIASQSEAAQ